MGYSTWNIPNATNIKRYRRAAEQGSAPAQFYLSMMYNSGYGVPHNYAEAYVWSSIAVLSGNERAMGNRDFAASKLSSEDIGAAQKRATKLRAEIQQKTEGE